MKVSVAILLCKYENHVAVRAIVTYVTAEKFEKADRPTTTEAGGCWGFWWVRHICLKSVLRSLNVKNTQDPSEAKYFTLQ